MSEETSIRVLKPTKIDFNQLKAEVEAKFTFEDAKIKMSADEFLKILMVVYRSQQETVRVRAK